MAETTSSLEGDNCKKIEGGRSNVEAKMLMRDKSSSMPELGLDYAKMFCQKN